MRGLPSKDSIDNLISSLLLLEEYLALEVIQKHQMNDKNTGYTDKDAEHTNRLL